MIELILTGFIVMLLNVLDSVSTSLAFKQYPDKKLEGEGNPFMRGLMLKSRNLAELVKQGGVLIIVALLVMLIEIEALRLIGILLGIVVLNNSFVIVSRAIVGYQLQTPFAAMEKALHIPESISYFVAVVIIIGLARLISVVVW